MGAELYLDSSEPESRYKLACSVIEGVLGEIGPGFAGMAWFSGGWGETLEPKAPNKLPIKGEQL